jgi:hypothetical protein
MWYGKWDMTHLKKTKQNKCVLHRSIPFILVEFVSTRNLEAASASVWRVYRIKNQYMKCVKENEASSLQKENGSQKKHMWWNIWLYVGRYVEIFHNGAQKCRTLREVYDSFRTGSLWIIAFMPFTLSVCLCECMSPFCEHESIKLDTDNYCQHFSKTC